MIIYMIIDRLGANPTGGLTIAMIQRARIFNINYKIT